MATAHIHAGVCGFVTRVQATLADDGQHVDLAITSDCPAVQALAAGLAGADAYRETTYRGQGPLTLALAAARLPHPTCPVPAGILKAIEVAAGLALPAAVHIDLSA